MNERYFDKSRSAAVFSNGDDRCILEMLASRFIGNHPAVPYQYKMDFENGIICDAKGCYQFDLGKRFPDAKVGSKCIAKGRLWSFQERNATFVLTCIGPTICNVNARTVFDSNPEQEGNREVCRVLVALRPGWNDFTFETEKTTAGLGFTFGNAMAQWEPYLFQSPLPEREGQLGFVYSGPIKTEIEENDHWYPVAVAEKNSNEIVWNQVFDQFVQGWYVAKARIVMHRPGWITVSGEFSAVFIDGLETAPEQIALAAGEYLIVIWRKQLGDSASGSCSISIDGGSLRPWIQVQGYQGSWLYTGPFGDGREINMRKLNRAIDLQPLYLDGTGPRYWRTAVPHGVVRICAEAELYGRWTYPMGVTLYGLLTAAEYLGRPDYQCYVKDNVSLITAHQNYAWYDKQHFGFPSLNQQICWLTELDDCGSFGALILECDKRWRNQDSRQLAAVIGEYMRAGQCRRADGIFCRRDQTIWIDDLYMSIPFLVRYSSLTGEDWYLDEACRQIKLFHSYFYLENLKLMSHIYDIKWEKANQIPWSRGNGWVIFALTELLAAVPEQHPEREWLVTFYREMAAGLLQVQGVNGLWHQVLDDSTTYEESSSTAMFICAFARGSRAGYAGRALTEKLCSSVRRAWAGLTDRTIDCQGNLYGVCQGSGRSFSRDYYRSLTWRYNDPHGIGIVLMAGVEACRLKEWEQKEAADES